MARKFNGTTDAALSSAAVDLSGGSQFSLAYWLWLDDANFHVAMEAGTNYNSNTDAWLISPLGALPGKFQFATRGDVGYSDFNFDMPSTGAWHHYVALFDKSLSTNEVSGYLDGVVPTGVQRTVNANNTNNFGSYAINFMDRSGGSFFCPGRLAEVGLWPGLALGTNDISALAAGYRPIHVRSDKLGWYWPCRYPGAAAEPELVKANAMTLTGTSSADHPRIIY